MIYDRVSSDPTGAGRSVASQDEENRAFCERQGWEVVAVLQDNDRSASPWATKDRPEYRRMREMMAAGEVDVVVCWESSRAQRDLEAYVGLRALCQQHEVLWAYSGRVYDLSRTDDIFSTGLDALLSEREVRGTRDRILRDIRTHAAKGGVHGTVPYGYRREYHPGTGKLVAQVLDPETAPIVEEIVERIIGGETLYSLVQDLNARGVITPQARKDREKGVEVRRDGWTSSKIRALLRSPSITGRRTHRGVISPRQTWTPIVTEADFALVNSILADPRRARHHRGVAPRYLLSGIAECGAVVDGQVCGAFLRPAKIRGRLCYMCGGRGENLGKGHVSCLRDALDAVVTAYIVGRLQDPAFLDGLARPDVDHDVAAARREIAGLRAQLADVVEQVRHRKMSAQMAGEIEKGILDDIAAAERRAVPHWVPDVVVDLAGADAEQKWDAAALATRRTVLRALQKIVLHSAKPGFARRGFDVGRVEILDL